MSDMEFLITGGSGFVGSHLAEKLINLNHKVINFDLNLPQRPELYSKVVIGDINDFENLVEAAHDADCIFDCAGIVGSTETFSYIEHTFENNLFGTLNILNLAKKFNIPIVHLSLKNDCMNPYMISKRASTELCMSYSSYLNTKVCVINGLNGYGPGQKLKPIPKMVPGMITNILKNKKILINGDGKQIVDMIYIDDLVHIMYVAFKKKCWGSVFDAGTGIPKTVLQIANDIISILEKGDIEFIPMRKGEHEGSIALADPSFLVQYLDYYPKTTWKEGCKKTVEWYKNYF